MKPVGRLMVEHRLRDRARNDTVPDDLEIMIREKYSSVVEQCERRKG